jgi:hypothetical protein
VLEDELALTAEGRRLLEDARREQHWKRWGPYLSERAWGTVREDYSQGGTAWDYFPHDHARSRAYRWNEDGLGGICDRHQHICFALALWNERDSILKERLFGLSGTEGNHGEDVKEHYFYVDSTPTHSYMRFLYKYPQAAYPYAELVRENVRRGRRAPEYEIHDTGAFDDHRYFDVVAEYAKSTPEDICVRLSIFNRGPEAAPIHVLPTIWFRNTWSWQPDVPRPRLQRADGSADASIVMLDEHTYGRRWLYCDQAPPLLFTENETNARRLWGLGERGFFKDGINDAVVNGRRDAVNPAAEGTKAAAHYRFIVPAGGEVAIDLRFTDRAPETLPEGPFSRAFASVVELRRGEADDFYATVIPRRFGADAQLVTRQAFAGLLWTKQFYHYVVRDWLNGDPGHPAPPRDRRRGRNHDWAHLYNADVISMPDKWEYPWYAAWDLAFHCVPLAIVDPAFAKDQIVLMLREWYMHPNGQLPAYEWALGDVNPPVHAWAAWRVYKIEKKRTGIGDRVFLERVFQKLLLNFTWWINRKDAEGNNVFQGGFLGLDNIGVFDRSTSLPTGGHLEQSDGTSWMAMYCLNMLAIAMELAADNPAYEDVASKFWEHFLYIAYAMNTIGEEGGGLWDEEDGFFYDVLHLPDNTRLPMKIRSMVGLIPLFAVETLDEEAFDRLPAFKRRMEWFIQHRSDLTQHVASMKTRGSVNRRLLAVVWPHRLRRVLKVLLDEAEFLSPYGIRSLSRRHLERPYTLHVNGTEHRVGYEPGESTTGLFGGNSNWRGPIWLPVNFLLIESLQKFHRYVGDDFRVECPTGSGQYLTLDEIAAQLSQRLSRLFLRDADGRRPVFGRNALFQEDPHWRDLVPFHEYFHGDTGEGLGASHQTGWTALVAKLLLQSGVTEEEEPRTIFMR